MKKWENPELMTLGVENTKEDKEGQEPRLICMKCGEWYWHWEKHHCPAKPGEGPYPPPTPELPGPTAS
ncbi:hypothetical protein GNF80_04160 [Clostridium perfringens]|nr:hypothetical protein [Clostridium perfringens]